MMLTYELTIWLAKDECSWSDAHRFPERPDLHVIQFHVEKAHSVFRELYDCEPEESTIDLDYLSKRDREEIELEVDVPNYSEKE